MASKDFASVRAAALAMAPLLLAEWLGGARHGNEWHGARKADGGLGDSWKVNLDTGVWAHFGSAGPGSTGGDLIDLYAALNHLNVGPAYEAVARAVGINGSGVHVLPTSAPRQRKSRPERPADPIPANAPPIPQHHALGQESAAYRYGDSFVVARYDLPGGGKSFVPYTWRNNKWAMTGFTGQRPLYNLAELAERPRASVLVVEGEKCAEIAKDALPSLIVVTWANGAQSVDRTDWEPLRGRDVVIWPDADEAGAAAAAQIKRRLDGGAQRLRILRPIDRPGGWDIADAIAEGVNLDAFIEEHVERPPAPVGELITREEQANSEDYPAGQPARSSMVLWKDLSLACDHKDVPHSTLANVSLILQFHPEFKGKIWWDSFCERIYHTLHNDTPTEWNDIDSARVAAFMQQEMQLPKVTLKLVQDTIPHAAHANPRNSVENWLDGLVWDGTERLSTWVGDCLGVDLTPYTMAVSRNWIVSMVARAYRPGCQVDTMPVLEGLQGEGKSSALEILGDRWYAAVGTAFGSYDFIQTIQGKWLIEIPDMAGFSKREHSHVIATITTRTDRYRMKYGRFDQDHPRKCVFAATSETDDYLPEMRGYRRYWPLRCKGIDLDSLRGQREQIFAEAVQAYRAGAGYHQMPAKDTLEEQQARGADDPWTFEVMKYSLQRALVGHPVHPVKALTDSGLEMKPKELDYASKMRVVNILKAQGWEPRTIDNQRCWIKPRARDLGD